MLLSSTTTSTIWTQPSKVPYIQRPMFRRPRDTWSDPELSVGQRCPVNISNSDCCWAAVGPAREAWDNICEQIKELFQNQSDYLDEGEETALNFSYGIWMIGRDAAHAVPTIVLGCKSKNVRTKAKELLKKSGLLDPYPRIVIKRTSSTPEPLGADEHPSTNEVADSVNSIIYSNANDDDCVAQIIIGRSDELLPITRPQATIGRYILVDGKAYGLTVSHVFDPTYGSSEPQDKSNLLVFDEDSESDNDSLVEMTSKGSITPSESSELSQSQMVVNKAGSADLDEFNALKSGPELDAQSTAKLSEQATKGAEAKIPFNETQPYHNPSTHLQSGPYSYSLHPSEQVFIPVINNPSLLFLQDNSSSDTSNIMVGNISRREIDNHNHLPSPQSPRAHGSQSLRSADDESRNAAFHINSMDTESDNSLSSTTSPPLVKIGELFIRSQSSLDWALIELQSRRWVGRNKIGMPGDNFQTPISLGSFLYVNRLAPRVEESGRRTKAHSDVLIATGRTGVIRGVLLQTPTYIRPRGSRGFRKVWAINSEQPLVAGDCGSWVINAVTGDFHGVIIAGNDDTQLAFIILAQDLFENISQITGSYIQLPPKAPSIQGQTPQMERTLDARTTFSFWNPEFKVVIIDEDTSSTPIRTDDKDISGFSKLTDDPRGQLTVRFQVEHLQIYQNIYFVATVDGDTYVSPPGMFFADDHKSGSSVISPFATKMSSQGHTNVADGSLTTTKLPPIQAAESISVRYTEVTFEIFRLPIVINLSFHDAAKDWRCIARAQLRHDHFTETVNHPSITIQPHQWTRWAKFNLRVLSYYSRRREGQHPEVVEFRRLQLLYKGRPNSTYQVLKKGTSTPYVMKTYNSFSSWQIYVVEIKQELSKLESVVSPFVAQIRMAFFKFERLCLFASFAGKEQLFWNASERGRFSEDRIKFYIAEILCGMKACHDAGLICRLTPEKILLDARGHVVLSSFGLLTIASKPRYGEFSRHSIATDLWSLGFIMLEMGVEWKFSSSYTSSMKERFFDAGEVSQTQMNDTFEMIRFMPYDLSPAGRSFLQGLLNPNPQYQLGVDNGAYDLMVHPWFNGIDWEEYNQGQAAPPYQPQLSTSPRSLIVNEVVDLVATSRELNPWNFLAEDLANPLRNTEG